MLLTLFASVQNVPAAPPSPQSFVPNRAATPRMVLLNNMKANISNGVRDVVYVWNRRYSSPEKQVADLLRIFKYLSDAPVMPRQMLLNETFELDKVMKTERLLDALETYQKELNRSYRTLFDYSSLIVGTKEGNIMKTYKKLLRDMEKMVDSYNHLARVVNREYRKKVMPYYRLDLKK